MSIHPTLLILLTRHTLNLSVGTAIIKANGRKISFLLYPIAYDTMITILQKYKI